MPSVGGLGSEYASGGGSVVMVMNDLLCVYDVCDGLLRAWCFAWNSHKYKKYVQAQAQAQK
jgi:hypothetical protein